MKAFLKKPFILPIIILIAIVLVVYKVKSKPPITHEILSFPVKTVEVIKVKRLPFRARAIGYGNVEPSIVVHMKTEVAGRVSYMHPALKKGGSLAKGTVALRIEPTTFKFSLDQSSAVLSANESTLTQLAVEEDATRISLLTAQKNLNVGKKELSRQTSIWKKKLIARSAVDAEEQKVLQLLQQVEDLQGKLTGYTSRKAATQAQIKQSESQLAQSQDTLGRTEIVMPFDARIGVVSVEQGEFTNVGGVLFEALGIQAVEINTQLPSRQFRPLLRRSNDQVLPLQTSKDLKSAISKLQLSAKVSLVGFDGDAQEWPGKLIRISESIDPTRDTIGLVVSVKDPYKNVVPGKRPPLLKGMYVAVEFTAPLQELLVIPRRALHQGRVYIAKPNNELEIRSIKIAYQQGNLVVIEQGIDEGERLIVTDVIPVMDGLPLNPIVNSKSAKQLAARALGEQP